MCNTYEISLAPQARHMNMEQIGVFAPGTKHELDPGNQFFYHHIDGRQLYRAGGTAVGHSTKIIAVG